MLSVSRLSDEAASIVPPVEALTLSKIRKRILPCLWLLYVVAYLDRTNISYAALSMNAELGISAQQFGMVAGIFFLGYVLFEVPSNLMLARFGARRWISWIMIVWGAIATATGFVDGLVQLYALRFCLGIAEAGFFPGVAFYLIHWFPRRNRATAMASFTSAQIACNLLGPPVSGLLMDQVAWLGVSGWRWMIVLEGMPAILLGILVGKYLDDGPALAKWLSSTEKMWLASELSKEKSGAAPNHEPGFRALYNLNVLYLAVTYFFIVLAIYGVTFWAPIVIRGLSESLSNTEVGWLSTIPTLVGGAAMLVNAWHSDRTMERRWHVISVVLIGAFGLFLMAATSHIWLSIGWLSLVAIAAYGYLGAWWAIPTSFLTGHSAAIGLAVINSIGNLGGFVGPLVVGVLVTSTGNQKAGLFLLGASFVVGAVLLAAYRLPPVPKPSVAAI